MIDGSAARNITVPPVKNSKIIKEPVDFMSKYEESFIKNRLYSRVEAALKKSENAKILIDYISKYFDRNSHILFDVNFSERLIVSITDKEIINTATGISIEEVSDVISKSNISKLDWVSNPFTILMALAVRYFTINNHKKEADLSIIYIACLYYTLMHSKVFRLGPPNREIMDYVLNRNPSVTNSFIIKKEGSIFGMLKYTGVTSHEFYAKDLIGRCTDVQLNNYLSAIRTRIGSNMKNLAKYFYEDHKQGHYFNKDTESYEEGNFHMINSTSLAIAKLASKVATNLISYRFDSSFIEKAATASPDVGQTKLIQILDNVLEDHRKDLEKFISTIIELYVQDGNLVTEVATFKFLVHAMNTYKTNSTKKNVLEIKEYLDIWIGTGSQKYGNKFIRPITIDAYRKAMYKVFIYTINKEAK